MKGRLAGVGAAPVGPIGRVGAQNMVIDKQMAIAHSFDGLRIVTNRQWVVADHSLEDAMSIPDPALRRSFSEEVGASGVAGIAWGGWVAKQQSGFICNTTSVMTTVLISLGIFGTLLV